MSSSLASQLEAESMWQGRAQGLQQQLDQAVQEKQQLQLSMGAAQAAVSEKQQSVRWVWLALSLSFAASTRTS